MMFQSLSEFIHNKYIICFLATFVYTSVILISGNPLAIGATLSLLLLISPLSQVNPVISIVQTSEGKYPVNILLPIIGTQLFAGLISLEIYKRWWS